MKYQVKLHVFEGPLDLLLHLIEKNEVDIYDIPIAEITRQYLAYLETMERMDLEIASEFLVMAATLLSIKAKMLVPKPPKIDDEDAQEIEFDPRDELVERLLEYKKYKVLAEYLQQLEEIQEKVFYRPNEEEQYLNAFSESNPLEGLTLDDLIKALQDVVNKIEPEDLTKEILREEITIKDKIDEITSILSTHPRGVSFRELFSKPVGRVEMIVQFLALLELVRLQVALVRQSSPFGEIIIYPIANV